MKRRIALLSNINMNFVLRTLQKNHEIYATQGYGNELGLLIDGSSSYHAFDPEYTFFVMDLLEVLEHNLDPEVAEKCLDRWFDLFEAGMKTSCQYYISDAYLWGVETESLFVPGQRQTLEGMWNSRLKTLCEKYPNVHVFLYHDLISRLGEENSFSLKMWYMGKMLHTNEAQKRIGEQMEHILSLASRVPKKVLLLDLDDTLWGGIVGEHEHKPIVLSDDHAGLAYKNLQRVILQMQKAGTLLGIVSKNNERDALDIIRNHPHMVLREKDFAIRKINWEPKSDNIQAIAQELNLGLDSFVFWDDNPTERELVKQMLPQVCVPDFPERPEELAAAMNRIYHTYFEKTAVTAEDLDKTRQYAENAKRSQMQKQAVSFEEYLMQLQIKVTRVDAGQNIERLVQLVNKTNQFNLTTKRYEMAEMQKILKDDGKRVYLYRIEDRFGDYGIVAAAIVDVVPKPIIEEFVLSCRVMGKNVEYGIVSDMERDLAEAGYDSLLGMYIPTAKNQPVENLYDRLGYEEIQTPEEHKMYEIDLNKRPKRAYYGVLE